jgi:predicted membrane channel-forming protein YqfA (hemolysin III family)
MIEPMDDRLDDALRERALNRLKKKSDFHAHLLVYLLVNASLTGIWFFTGHGYFWPIFPILFWGIGLIMNAWDVYRRHDYTEMEIREEMHRIR